MSLSIVQYPMFSDNYGYLLQDQQSRLVAAVDPADVDATVRVLSENDWQLSFIFNTHHHADHIGGNSALKKAYGCQIYAPQSPHIKDVDETVGEGQSIRLGESDIAVMAVPGHTLDHIAYYSQQAQALFCGDTLFALGCGRLFEGRPEQMWSSLTRLAALPGQTRVYCAHEYTASNLRFTKAVSYDHERLAELEGTRVPTTIAFEQKNNPFLRCREKRFRDEILPGSNEIECFVKLRAQKDKF
jgi:hydroxyacylglutathione hydrolase